MYNTTEIYRSLDNGATWSNTATITGLLWGSLFVLGSNVYSIGYIEKRGSLVLWSSADDGFNWSGPVLLWDQGVYYGGNAGGSPPAIIDGVLYHAFGISDSLSYAYPQSLNMAAIPVSSDLTNPANWTITTYVPPVQQIPSSWLSTGWSASAVHGGQWVEHQTIEWPVGLLRVLSRIQTEPDIGKRIAIHIIDTSTLDIDLSQMSPTTTVGDKKFSCFVDDGRLFLVGNENPYQGLQWANTEARNVLSLYSTANGLHWQRHKRLIDGSAQDPEQFGYQYPCCIQDGNDLIATVREADADADNAHNANYLTFYRWSDWRDGWDAVQL
jgi:hypothetical protein